jgi:hypothetical protein
VAKAAGARDKGGAAGKGGAAKGASGGAVDEARAAHNGASCSSRMPPHASQEDDDLQLAIGADGGDWSVAGGSSDWLGYPTDWSVSLHDSATSAVLLDELWSSAVDYTPADPVTSYPLAFEAPITGTTVVTRTMDGAAQTETVNTLSFDSLRSLGADPLPRVSAVFVEGPSSLVLNSAQLDGGALYLEDTSSALNFSADLTLSENKAGRNGSSYKQLTTIHQSSLTLL